MATVDVPVNFRDYDPTINPTNNIEPYDAMSDYDPSIQPRPSISDEQAKGPKDATVPEALLKAMAEYALLVSHARRLERELAGYYAKYLAVIRRQAELTKLKETAATPIEAWCADYSTGLEVGTTIATLEVPGEVDPVIGGGVNIKPGADELAYWRPRYGQIQFGTALSPAGFAWNMTMLTPWMKWMPLWRYALVQSKDEAANTVNVTLNPIVSKVGSYMYKDRSLNVPWQNSMINVPVEYMGCGAAIFEAGDEVIVEFRGGGAGGLSYYEPYVIGFKDHPKMCEHATYIENPPTVLSDTITAYALNLNSGVGYTAMPALGLNSLNDCRGAIPTSDGGWIIVYLNTAQSQWVVERKDKTGAQVWLMSPSFSFNGMAPSVHPTSHLVALADRNNLIHFIQSETGDLMSSQAVPATGNYRLNGIGFLPDGTPIYSMNDPSNDPFENPNPSFIQIGDTTVSVSGWMQDSLDQVWGAGYYQGFIWAMIVKNGGGSNRWKLAKVSTEGSLIGTYDFWRAMDADGSDGVMGAGYGIAK